MFEKTPKIKLFLFIILCFLYIFCIIITKLNILDGIFYLVIMYVFFYVYLNSFFRAIYQKSIPILNIIFCLFLTIGSPILFFFIAAVLGQSHFNNDSGSFLMLSIIFMFVLGVLGLFVPTIIRYFLYRKEKKLEDINKNITVK